MSSAACHLHHHGREALRGAEEETFDLLAQFSTPTQWAKLLNAPLELAAAKGKRGLAQRLVTAGADMGEALHKAAVGGYGGIVNDLLDGGAPIAARDSGGFTALHHAARGGNLQVVELLLLKGADKDEWDNGACYTPLHLAVRDCRVAAALALVAAGADVSLPTGRSKRSLLHAVVLSGLRDLLRAVVKGGADVNAADEYGWTPLHAAARGNNAEAIDVLVEAGAVIEALEIQGCTPLHEAAQWHSPDALLALLKHGAHVNAQDNHQQTALHYAVCKAGVRKGTADMVAHLLRAGADETILNGEGRTAADVAVFGIGGRFFPSACNLTEDVDLVRNLLANAPADRAWRRRGYLVLCRAHPDRVRLVQESGISAPAGAIQQSITSGGAALEMTGMSASTEVPRGSTAGFERKCHDWAGVVETVLRLQEEVIFRKIVGYL